MHNFTGVHRDARTIIQSLPILAAVMAEDAGVTVNFTTTARTGMTDGKRIVLPVIPLPTDAATSQELGRLATYYFGLEDHEIGHCRVSDLPDHATALQNAKPIVRSLFNVIEDPRMETAHGIHYPGADRNMRNLSILLVEEGQDSPITAQTPASEAITGWVCHFLRFAVRGEECYRAHAADGEVTLRSIIGETAVSRIKGYLSRATGLTSSLDALKLARHIALAIEEESAKEPPPPPETPETPEPSDCATSASSQPSSGPETNAEPGPDDQAEAPASQGEIDALKEASASGHVHADRGDAVREILISDIDAMIESGHAQPGDATVAPAVGAGFDTSATPLTLAGVIDMETVRGVSARARTRLTALFQAETRAVTRVAKRGKAIESKLLYRLRTADTRVFLRVQEVRGLDTALFLLLDVSGSMQRDDQILIAREAMLATAIATEMLSGVAVATGTFPGYNMLQTFGTKAKMTASNYAVAANGDSSPLANGMIWAGKMLAQRREAKKMLIVATDGIPDSVPAALSAGTALKAMNVAVVGYGIGVDISHVLPHSKQLANVGELPTALMALLQNVIVQPIAA
jgi:cobaltochelatase CobT